VVAARSGGITDIVEAGVNGYLFDPNDENGAIAATQTLLDQHERREHIRHQARLEAERWSWAAATRQLQSYYRQILSSMSLPHAA
jgi:glycosyltransferase involved in cell wall biosynthesis